MIATTLATLLAAFAPPPTCMPSTVSTAPGVPVAVQTNCVDTGANPTVTVTTPPVSGTLTGFPGLYVPAPGFRGTDHLRYTVTNIATGETSQETTINVVVNSRPSCADGTATTRVNTPLKLAFPCSDPDGGTVLIRAEDGQHGVVDPDVGSQLTYTPDPGYVGTDEISFAALDGAFVTASRTLTITIAPAPEPTATATPDPTVTPGPTASPVPTASPTPPAPGATPDRTAPTVSVKAGKASIAKGVTFTLTSSEAATAKLTLAAGKHTAAKRTKLTTGTTKVTLKLSAKARKALKSKKSVKARLTVVATDTAGNRATKKLSVTLRR